MVNTRFDKYKNDAKARHTHVFSCALILNLAELLLFYLQQGGNRYFLMDQFMKEWIESNRIFSLHNVKHTKCYLFNGPFIAHFPFGDGVIDSSWWTLVQKIQFYLFVQVLKQIVITGANSYFVLLWEKFKVIHFRWVKMIGVWKLPASRWTFIYSMFDLALKMPIKLLINLSKFFGVSI